MAVKKGNGSKSRSTKTNKDVRLRKGLAFLLYIIYWIMLIGTFVLDFQESQRSEPQQILSGGREGVTGDMTD